MSDAPYLGTTAKWSTAQRHQIRNAFGPRKRKLMSVEIDSFIALAAKFDVYNKRRNPSHLLTKAIKDQLQNTADAASSLIKTLSSTWLVTP
jgi:hypothetical protein